jgi:hypothetical protein
MATYPMDRKYDERFDEKSAAHSRDEELFDHSERPTYLDDDGEEHYRVPPATAKDLATEVIHARDDPTLNPWTFRTWFLGAHSFHSVFQN